MPIFSQIERLCTDRTLKQVWKNSGKAQHPNFKVAGRDVQWTVVLDRLQHHPDEPENRVMRLMFREKAVGQIHHVPGKNRAVVIGEQGHR